MKKCKWSACEGS